MRHDATRLVPVPVGVCGGLGDGSRKQSRKQWTIDSWRCTIEFVLFHNIMTTNGYIQSVELAPTQKVVSSLVDLACKVLWQVDIT